MGFFDFFKRNVLFNITNPRYWLIIGSIGVWILVLQNFGVFGEKSQRVYVTGGDVDADVRGSVSVDGPVRVNCSVSCENTVEVNLYKINGYRNCFYNSYSKHPNDYYRIPVADY